MHFLYTKIFMSKTSIVKRAWVLPKIQFTGAWLLKFANIHFSKAPNLHVLLALITTYSSMPSMTDRPPPSTAEHKYYSLLKNKTFLWWEEIMSFPEWKFTRGTYSMQWVKRINMGRGEWKEACRNSINEKYFHASMLNMIFSYNEL